MDEAGGAKKVDLLEQGEAFFVSLCKPDSKPGHDL